MIFKDQVVDVAHEIGCSVEEESGSLCMDLYILEKYLELEMTYFPEIWHIYEKMQNIRDSSTSKEKEMGWAMSFLHVRKNASKR